MQCLFVDSSAYVQSTSNAELITATYTIVWQDLNNVCSFFVDTRSAQKLFKNDAYRLDMAEEKIAGQQRKGGAGAHT